MRKRITGRKLSRTTNERKQLFTNQIRSLIENGHIVTSYAKAKSIQPQVERMVTLGKNGSLMATRELIAQTRDVVTAHRLRELGKLFAKRPGGYTRLIRLGHQAGDNSLLVRLEWVEKLAVPEVVVPKAAQKKADDKKLPAKAAGTKTAGKEKRKNK